MDPLVKAGMARAPMGGVRGTVSGIPVADAIAVEKL